MDQEEHDFVPDYEEEVEQIGRDKRKRLPCPVCPAREVHVKRHVIKGHLPWYFIPETACWVCGHHEAKVNAILAHIGAEHQVGDSERVDRRNWSYLICGFLFSICKELGLSTLQELLGWVIAEKLYTGGAIVSEMDRINFMRFEEDSGFHSGGDYQLSPPSAIVCMLQWRIMGMILSRFSVEKRCELKNSVQLLSVNGSRVGRYLPTKPVIGIDAHLHLSELLERTGDVDLSEVIRHQPGHPRIQIGGVVSNHCFPNRWPSRREIVRITEDPRVHLSFGIHPKSATCQSNVLRELGKLLEGERVVALGEVGLDFSRGPSERTRQVQKNMLHQVLQMAVERDLPIVLHCRGGEEESAVGQCLRIFEGVVSRGHAIHFHCYMGTLREAQLWLNSFPNTRFGFTGAVLRSQEQERMAEVVKKLPLDHILLESDAPFISTSGTHPGNPMMIWDVATFIARHRNLLVDTVVGTARRGAMELYRL